MAIEITIPRLGWSMDEGAFGEWLIADGESVEPGDPLFTLESEKALQEVESIDGGLLHILPGGPSEGDTVEVGMRIGWLLEAGESPPSDAPAISQTHEAPARADASSAGNADTVQATRRGTIETSDGSSRLRISPRAARVAAELGVNPAGVSGTGRGGRIREADIRRATAAIDEPRPVSSRPSAEMPTLRRTIAARMANSSRTTAAVTLTTRADAESLIETRQQLAASPENEIVPSFQDMIVRVVACALREHPVINSQWTDDGLVQPDGIHIGIAVDTPDGLIVPVLRNAERLELASIAEASRSLIERAQSRRCAPQDLTGGTFTITNLGAFGIDAFTPIINRPETAVLGIGTIRREAVVAEDGGITARHRVTLSLTFDHRVTDGAPAARFLETVVQSVESGDGI